MFATLISLSLSAALPETLTGGWGLSATDCRIGPGAEGYLEITSDALHFYESTATLRQIEQTTDTGLIATFAFSGEGETWTRAMSLSVERGGQSLVRTDMDEAAKTTTTYQRCT